MERKTRMYRRDDMILKSFVIVFFTTAHKLAPFWGNRTPFEILENSRRFPAVDEYLFIQHCNRVRTRIRAQDGE